MFSLHKCEWMHKKRWSKNAIDMAVIVEKSAYGVFDWQIVFVFVIFPIRIVARKLIFRHVYQTTNPKT